MYSLPLVQQRRRKGLGDTEHRARTRGMLRKKKRRNTPEKFGSDPSFTPHNHSSIERQSYGERALVVCTAHASRQQRRKAARDARP